MERKPDGGVVFRSSRAEEKEATRHNSQKQKAMELLFAKIQAEFENDERGNNQDFNKLATTVSTRASFYKVFSLGNIKPHRRRKTISRQEIAGLQDGEELHDAVGDDPAYLEVVRCLR